MAAVEAIGVISGVIGIFQFAMGLIPDAPEEAVQVFDIGVGLDGTAGDGANELTGAGGYIQNVVVYDNNGAQISQDGEHGIGLDEGTDDIIEVPLIGNDRGYTANFWGSDDAICIGTISTTLHNGDQFGFVGDWSEICDGVLGYPSGIEANEGDSEYNARCIWIDGNGDAGDATSIAIHFPSVSEMAEGEDVAARCGQGAGFRAWDRDGNQIAAPPSSSKKRSVMGGASHPGRRDDRLVISDRRSASHQARNVCDNPFNYGPDFVSVRDMTYCNMSSREVLPLCGSEADDGGECFDLDESRGHGPAKRSAPGRLERALGARQVSSPSKIIDWTRK